MYEKRVLSFKNNIRLLNFESAADSSPLQAWVKKGNKTLHAHGMYKQLGNYLLTYFVED